MKTFFKNINLFELSGLLFSSFLFFIYISLIITLSAAIVFPYFKISLQVTMLEVLLFPCTFIFFELLFFIYSYNIIHGKTHKLPSKISLFRFILDTVIFFISVTLIIIVFRNISINTIIKIYIIITLVFLASFPFFNQIAFFIKLFYINTFYNFVLQHNLLNSSVDNRAILNYNDFIIYSTVIINQCIRLNNQIGVFSFSFQGSSEYKKQISFLLTEISRSHESWYYLKDQNTNIFFNIIHFKDAIEFTTYCNRLSNEINNFTPLINNENKNLSYNFFNFSYPKDYFENIYSEDYEINFINEIIQKIKGEFSDK